MEIIRLLVKMELQAMGQRGVWRPWTGALVVWTSSGTSPGQSSWDVGLHDEAVSCITEWMSKTGILL